MATCMALVTIDGTLQHLKILWDGFMFFSFISYCTKRFSSLCYKYCNAVLKPMHFVQTSATYGSLLSIKESACPQKWKFQAIKKGKMFPHFMSVQCNLLSQDAQCLIKTLQNNWPPIKLFGEGKQSIKQGKRQSNWWQRGLPVGLLFPLLILLPQVLWPLPLMFFMERRNCKEACTKEARIPILTILTCVAIVMWRRSLSISIWIIRTRLSHSRKLIFDNKLILIMSFIFTNQASRHDLSVFLSFCLFVIPSSSALLSFRLSIFRSFCLPVFLWS